MLRFIPFCLVTNFAFAQSSLLEIDGEYGDARSQILESSGFQVERPFTSDGKLSLIIPNSDLERFASLNIPFEVKGHSRPLRERYGSDRAIDGRFFTPAEINQSLLDLNAQYPQIAHRHDLTGLTWTSATHDGNRIYAVVLSDNPQYSEDEPNILFVGNHHAREIATPAHMLALAESLCAAYGSDPEVTDWIQNSQIWIAPTWNPDGLDHVWNVDEWWRKNRRDNGGGVFGVDLNRNYLFDWANCGSYSHSPSSNVYCGPSPGSEPETRTMLAFARTMNFAKVIDVHQSGQEVLYPYACGSLSGPYEQKIGEIRDRLAQAANYSDRYASAGGEHFEWEVNEIGAMSFLIELDTTFHPSWSQSQAEIQRVMPLYEQMLREPLPASGHVRDARTGVPLDATIEVVGVPLLENETRMSRASNAGRFHLWLPDGDWTVQFSAQGYVSRQHEIVIRQGSSEALDVWLPSAGEPSLSLHGLPQVGLPVRFHIEHGTAYSGSIATVVLGASGGGPFGGSTALNGLVIPIVSDQVTTYCFNLASQFSTTLDAHGFGATPWFSIPPAGRGLFLHGAAVIHDGLSHLHTATPALPFAIE